jgi:hypothetical protein
MNRAVKFWLCLCLAQGLLLPAAFAADQPAPAAGQRYRTVEHVEVKTVPSAERAYPAWVVYALGGIVALLFLCWLGTHFGMRAWKKQATQPRKQRSAYKSQASRKIEAAFALDQLSSDGEEPPDEQAFSEEEQTLEEEDQADPEPMIPVPAAGGYFTVSGVDRTTRQDVTLQYHADSPENAKVKAELEGIAVTRVVPA